MRDREVIEHIAQGHGWASDMCKAQLRLAPFGEMEQVAAETILGLSLQIQQLDYSSPWALERAKELAHEIANAATMTMAFRPTEGKEGSENEVAA